MGTINDLRVSIKARLDAILPAGWKAYSELSVTDLPRCVFFLTGTGADGGEEYFTLSIELNGKDTNTGTLDAACDAVKGNGKVFDPTGLDAFTTCAANVGWHAHLDNRGDQPTDEQNLRQRNLAFVVSAFFY